ncbi:MAG: sulfatase [Planctomycetota bacterium]
MNVLYIFTDQQSFETLSCAGNPHVRTPSLDRLAARGVRFERAYSVYPVCGPARAAMVTGRYPHEVGVFKNGDGIDETRRASEMGPVLAAAGYDCGYGGKWHLPGISLADGHGFRRISPFGDGDLASRAIAFLREPRGRPFLLVASFDNPHNICEWGRDQPLPWGEVEVPPVGRCPPLPANHAPTPYEPVVARACLRADTLFNYTCDYSPDDWRRYRAAYYRLVEKVDAEIGRILDALEALGLAERTLVIFASDHGEMNGAHQLIQKSHFYEESARVPFIVAGPGVAAGRVERRLVHSTLDLLPTVCDYAGCAPPADLPGRSLRPLLAGDEAAAWRTHLVGESAIDRHGVALRMVRTERYKYVVYEWGRYREQLYDLESDPGEMVNLAVEERQGGVLDEHRRLLADWCRRTGDRFGRHYARPEVAFNVPGMAFTG